MMARVRRILWKQVRALHCLVRTPIHVRNEEREELRDIKRRVKEKGVSVLQQSRERKQEGERREKESVRARETESSPGQVFEVYHCRPNI